MEIIESEYGLPPARESDTGPRRLRSLLHRLHKAVGQQAVVLVDEYDRPVLDVLHNRELATANRDYLRGFFGIIKDGVKHVRFVFVTRVSMFSGLNNLNDISLDPRFATICGYRGEDLEKVFGPELEGLDTYEIRRWYNGYHWRGGTRVYNPYDVLLLLYSREFQPHWSGTGTPNFLFQMLIKESISPLEMEDRIVHMSRISHFDVGNIDIEALLFQTGYLTIAEELREDDGTLYRLS